MVTRCGQCGLQHSRALEAHDGGAIVALRLGSSRLAIDKQITEKLIGHGY
jgi:hypothetical protein